MKKIGGLLFIFSLFFTGAASAGDWEKAEALFAGKQYREALQLYLKPGLREVPNAQSRIGMIYQKAPGLTDKKKSFTWFKKAAENGSRSGQYNLGLAYEDGAGTEKNYAEALKWYRKSAEQNYLNAYNAIGVMYKKGWGVKADPEEAAKWFAKAAEKGETASLCNLSIMTLHAQGIPKDYAKGKMLLEQCLQTDPDNICCLDKMADMYSMGWGVQKDDRKSLTLYERSARQGSARAMYNIANTYDYGYSGLKDPEAAMAWYLKAAAKDHAKALYRLYEIYEYGKLGQPVDKAKAAQWKAKAEAAMKAQGVSRNALMDQFRLGMEGE